MGDCYPRDMVTVAELADHPIRRLKRSEYHRLIAGGSFDEDSRVELLFGLLVEMSPQQSRHAGTVSELDELLKLRLSGRAKVRVQLPFAASDVSEPEPDIAVVPRGTYFDAHPDVAHLVIEVADTSLHKDRTIKATLYAEAGVPEYWVVDLTARLVEVYRRPEDGRYTSMTTYRSGETVCLEQFPEVEVAVDEFMPPAG